MKILRKGNDFKKVSDTSFDDLKKINDLLKYGWSYSPKKDYKEVMGKAKEVKDEVKKEKKEKKVEKKVEKKKVEKKKKK